MVRAAVCTILAAGVFWLGGCGTLENVCDGPTSPAERAVYGGVRMNAERAGVYTARAVCSGDPVGFVFLGGVAAYSLALELPLCLVADTLTLPITIPAALQKTDPGKVAPASTPTPDPESDQQSGLAAPSTPHTASPTAGQHPGQ